MFLLHVYHHMVMGVRQGRGDSRELAQARWLLLLFSLPAKQASKRVEVWRKLRRFGALSFRGSGYLLPNTPVNHERFEWLAAAIRKHKGAASVAELFAIDDLPSAELKRMFIEARTKDYEALLRDVKKQSPDGNTARLRRRLQEILDIDFFGSSMRARVETAIAALEAPPATQPAPLRGKEEFHSRVWVTRPRPGIDRVSSAWLIKNRIDPDAKFAFTNNVREVPDAVPFDMFNVGGFTHEGENCTFETLCKSFNLRGRRVRALSEIIHDADLNDDKFGRAEGVGLDRVLTGWAELDIPDEELLRRGMELIEGLYQSIQD